jgi:parvulin-like peptidyl-prolyl isomerase
LFPVALALSACGPSAEGQSVAARVNGHDISMSSYTKQVKYKRVVSTDTFGIDVCAGKGTAPLCDDLKQNALNGLIQDELVREYAAKHGITVSPAEFDRRWSVIYKQKFHNNKAVLAAYAKRYGLTPSEFKASIRRDALRDKVMAAVTPNLSTVAPAIELSRIDVSDTKQVKWLKAQLRAGRDFNAVAAQLNRNKKSLCAQQGGCGEMGWLPTAFVSPQRRGLISAKPGQVLGPFPGQRLYEFMKVEAKNPAYHMTPKQVYQRRQQVFTTWLAQQERHAAIERHVAT